MPLNQSTPRDAERLSLLYRISQTFNSSLDLDQVLNLIMDEVIAATRAERGFLMLGSDSRQLVFRAARGLDQHTIDDPQSQVSAGVIDRVVREGRPLLTSNAQSDDWLSERRSVVVLGLRSVLCVPLLYKGKTTGIIYVDNRVQSGIFTSDDLDLLTSIASSAAVAIENARLYQLAIEKGRMERELQLARQVQTSLLPTSLPEIPGWEFSARWEPAYEVAGDFYDIGQNENKKINLVIADVSDKGMASAFFMALTRTIIRATMYQAASLAEGISQANQLICSDSTIGMFVTLFFANLDPESGRLTYVNCGHNPPLHYQASQHRLTPLTRTGMALGVDETAIYEQKEIVLEPGDFVLFYTDGVTEAFNPQEIPFGVERLYDTLLSRTYSTAAEVIQTLLEEVRIFSGSATPSDDVTVIAVRRLTP